MQALLHFKSTLYKLWGFNNNKLIFWNILLNQQKSINQASFCMTSIAVQSFSMGIKFCPCTTKHIFVDTWIRGFSKNIKKYLIKDFVEILNLWSVLPTKYMTLNVQQQQMISQY